MSPAPWPVPTSGASGASWAERSAVSSTASRDAHALQRKHTFYYVKQGFVVKLKSLWALRAVVPPLSALAAAWAGWIHAEHLALAVILLGLAFLLQVALGVIQAFELGEPPANLKELAAAAAALMAPVGRIKTARANREAQRRKAWDVALGTLRSLIAPDGDEDTVRATFYDYDGSADRFIRARCLGRGNAAHDLPTELTATDGDVFITVKRVMRENRTKYFRRRRCWKKPAICTRLGARAVVIGPACQRQADGQKVGVGVVIVDADSPRTVSKHPATGWVSAIALLIAAEPIHEKIESA
jgi:hypothetical protein